MSLPDEPQVLAHWTPRGNGANQYAVIRTDPHHVGLYQRGYWGKTDNGNGPEPVWGPWRPVSYNVWRGRSADITVQLVLNALGETDDDTNGT